MGYFRVRYYRLRCGTIRVWYYESTELVELEYGTIRVSYYDSTVRYEFEYGTVIVRYGTNL